jgi:hypothetical protein
MAASDTWTTRSRRAFLTEQLLFPFIVSAVTGGLVQALAKQLEQRHRLSISILPLDDAEIKYEPVAFPPIVDEPVPTPVPGPNTRFSYVTIYRNDGDFSEANVAMALAFQGNSLPEWPLADPQVVFSTPLMREAVAQPLTRTGEGDYLLRLSRLNPGEAVSIQASWMEPMRVNAEVRSDTTTTSLLG